MTDAFDWSSPEVGEVFDRISGKVEMKGATDAAELESRLESYVHLNKTRAKIAKWESTKERDRWRAEQVDKLINIRFPERVIFEAIRARKGIIAQTLLFGREEAKRRVLEYRKRRIKAAYPILGVPPRAPGMPPRLETRRMRPWAIQRERRP